MDIELKVYCRECNKPQDESADIYCMRCYDELQDKVTELTAKINAKDKEISDLEDKIASLEKELGEKNG